MVPTVVAAGRNGAWAREPLHQHAHVVDLVEVGPAPAMGRARTAGTSRLIEKQTAFAGLEAEVVRLANAGKAGQGKREQAAIANRLADPFLDR